MLVDLEREIFKRDMTDIVNLGYFDDLFMRVADLMDEMEKKDKWLIYQL